VSKERELQQCAAEPGPGVAVMTQLHNMAARQSTAPAPSLVEQLDEAIRAILSDGHPYSKGAAEAVGILRAIQRAAREAGGR
jgi:hypothetical protein